MSVYFFIGFSSFSTRWNTTELFKKKRWVITHITVGRIQRMSNKWHYNLIVWLLIQFEVIVPNYKMHSAIFSPLVSHLFTRSHSHTLSIALTRSGVSPSQFLYTDPKSRKTCLRLCFLLSLSSPTIHPVLSWVRLQSLQRFSPLLIYKKCSTLWSYNEVKDLVCMNRLTIREASIVTFSFIVLFQSPNYCRHQSSQ